MQSRASIYLFKGAPYPLSRLSHILLRTSSPSAQARAEAPLTSRWGYRPGLSDLGAADTVNRARHLRLGVGQAVRAPDGRESRVLIHDTWNTDIVSALKPGSVDEVIYKTRFSGFYETDFDARLKGMGIMQLIFTGCTTSICVYSTVRDAMFRDYLPVLKAAQS